MYRSVKQDLWDYFHSTDPGCSIKVRPDLVGLGAATDPFVDYDPKRHGYLPLGNFYQEIHEIVQTATGKKSLRKTQVSEVLHFDLDPDIWGPPPRYVDVRYGNDHTALSEQLLIVEPASGAAYQVKFWQ